MIDKRILDDIALVDLIKHCKHLALEEMFSGILEMLNRNGFDFGDVLMGLAGCAAKQDLGEIERFLENAHLKYLEIQQELPGSDI